jgi:cardiolipin synthase
VVLRDFFIVLGFLLIHATTAPNQLGPLYISKINTLMQITLVGFVLARLGLEIETGPATWALIAAVAVTTVLSGLVYLVRWARVLLRPAQVL